MTGWMAGGWGREMAKMPPRFLVCAVGWMMFPFAETGNARGTTRLRIEFGGPLRQLEEVFEKYLALWGDRWASCRRHVMRK